MSQPVAEQQGNGNSQGQTGSNENQTMSVLTRGTFDVMGVPRQSITLDATDKALVTSMEDITTQELDDFVSKIDAIQSSEVLNLISSLFDFQGFDPIQVIKKLLAINKYYQTKGSNPPETHETLKQDIMLMVAANIIMGNLQMRSAGRRSEKGRAALEYLVSKYKMKIGSTGAGLPSDTLTFPRVANSFPVLTCRSAQALPSKNLSKSPFETKLIPKFMRVSAFASLCSEEMEERTREFLLTCVCAYSCDHMITVHEGEKKKRRERKEENAFLPEDAWAAQWDYILVSSTSPVPSLQMKRAMMTEFKVSGLYSVLEPIVRKSIDLLQSKWVIPTEQEFKKDIESFSSGTSQPRIAGA